MGGRWAWYERLIWPLSAGHSVGAHQLGLGKVGREEEWQGNCVKRLALRTRNRRGRRGERVFSGVSGRQRATKQHRVALCSGQRRRRQSSCRVSTITILAGEDCSTLCPCAFPIICSQLGPRPTAAATRGARRACATVCCDWKRLPEGGWRLSIGWPVKCGPRRGTNALSRFWVPERFVALSLSLTSS